MPLDKINMLISFYVQELSLPELVPEIFLAVPVTKSTFVRSFLSLSRRSISAFCTLANSS